MRMLITPLISTLINFALSRDPETAEKLAPHDSKIVQINFNLNFYTNIKIFIKIQHQKIIILRKLLLPEYAHTVIAGSPLELLSAVCTGKTGEISVSGDMLLAQDFSAVFKQLDIDWEEILSYFTGDTAAYGVGQLCRSLKNTRQKIKHSLGDHLREYLEDEQRLIVSRDETQDFCEEIDLTRLAVERLEARISFIAFNNTHTKII